MFSWNSDIIRKLKRQKWSTQCNFFLLIILKALKPKKLCIREESFWKIWASEQALEQVCACIRWEGQREWESQGTTTRQDGGWGEIKIVLRQPDRSVKSSSHHPWGWMNREQQCYPTLVRAKGHEERVTSATVVIGLTGMQPFPETKSKSRKKIPIPYPHILLVPPELNHRKLRGSQQGKWARGLQAGEEWILAWGQ